MRKCWCGCEDMEQFSPGYIRCKRCRTLISTYYADGTATSQIAESDLYGADYWDKYMVEKSGTRSKDELVDLYLSERVIYWTKNILRYKPTGGRAIEVASGLGQLSYMLSKAGYDMTAMEMSGEICQWIHEKLGLKVLEGEFKASPKAYDLIIANDLIEHLEDPEGFIKDTTNSLKDNGVIVLQTPCYDGDSSYQELLDCNARFLKQMMPEQHLFLFTRESISTLFDREGLKYYFEDAFFGNDYDMYVFVSKEELKRHTEEEINEYLYSVPDGRLIKSLISVFDDRNMYIKNISNEEVRLAQFDNDIRFLNEVIQEKNEELQSVNEEFRSAREELHGVSEELRSTMEDLQGEKQKSNSYSDRLSEIRSYSYAEIILDNKSRRHLYTQLSEYSSDFKRVRRAIRLLAEGKGDSYSVEELEILREYAERYIKLASFLTR